MTRTLLLAPAAHYAPWAAPLLRLGLGGVMLLHGVGKWLVVGLGPVAEGFAARGFPTSTAYGSVVVEIAAGALLPVGLATRAAALALAPLGGGRASLDGRLARAGADGEAAGE